MALLSRTELANQTGRTLAYLKVYEKRGKIIFQKDVNGKETIFDTNAPVNKEIFLKWTNEFLDKFKNGSEEEVKNAPNVKITRKILTNQNKGEDKNNTSEPTPIEVTRLLDQQKKTIEIQKAQYDLEILRQKLEKQQGLVIPVELVMPLFAQHTKNILNEYRNTNERLITTIAAKFKLNNSQIAELKMWTNREINLAGDRALEETKNNISSIQHNYSQKRGKGERND